MKRKLNKSISMIMVLVFIISMLPFSIGAGVPCSCEEEFNTPITLSAHGVCVTCTFENYIFNDDATCTADGTETSKCTHCDNTDTRSVAGSRLDCLFQPSTCCTTAGTHCNRGCNQDHSPLTHSWGNWTVIVQPSCYATGTQTRPCTRDNCTAYDSQTIPTIPHTPSAENCLECKDCGAVLTRTCTTSTPCNYHFISVENITNIPTTAAVNFPLTLSASVTPNNATRQTITWHIIEANNTGATLNGNVLTATAEGTVQIRATITNGATASTNFTHDFNITVNQIPNIGNNNNNNDTINNNDTGTNNNNNNNDTTNNDDTRTNNNNDTNDTINNKDTGTNNNNDTNDTINNKDTGTNNNNNNNDTTQTTTPTTEPIITIPTTWNVNSFSTEGETPVNIPVSINEVTGAVNVDLTPQATQNLVDNAITNSPDNPTIIFNLSGLDDARQVIFDADVIQVMENAGVSKTLILPNVELNFSAEALRMLIDSGAVDQAISITAEPIPIRDLSGLQQASVRGHETVIFIEVFVGDTKVNVPITVSVPHVLRANENPENIRAWHMDENGVLNVLDGRFDEEIGMKTFTIPHQSYFVVGYSEPVIEELGVVEPQIDVVETPIVEERLIVEEPTTAIENNNANWLVWIIIGVIVLGAGATAIVKIKKADRELIAII